MSTPRQKNLAVLGSTGSIGVNSLDVAARFPERFRVAGLAAGRNMKLLAKQAEAFKPRMVAVKGEEEAAEFKALAGAGAKYEIVFGEEGLIRLAAMESVDIVVSALVGAVGLAPTWAAVSAGKRVALANKETLVMAGELVMAKAKDSGAEILPVDSEHSAVFQVLSGQRRQDLKRIILTASGGPFRETGAKELAAVTKDQALNHPNWNMGAKISVDSATLMNKGLEAIEARWLFDLPWDLIDIQIHPQSIIHSMIELVDGSVLAQLGVPDMKIPIAYALSYPERLPLDLPGLDLPKAGALTFTEPDNERFPGLSLAWPPAVRAESRRPC